MIPDGKEMYNRVVFRLWSLKQDSVLICFAVFDSWLYAVSLSPFNITLEKHPYFITRQPILDASVRNLL